MGFLCGSFVVGLEYGQWTVAAVLGLWSLCTGLYAGDAAAGAEESKGFKPKARINLERT